MMNLMVFISLVFLCNFAQSSTSILYKSQPAELFLEGIFGRFQNISESLQKALNKALEKLEKKHGYSRSNQPATLQNKQKISFYITTKRFKRPAKIKCTSVVKNNKILCFAKAKKASKHAQHILSMTPMTQSPVQDPTSRPLASLFNAYQAYPASILQPLASKFLTLFPQPQNMHPALNHALSQGIFSTTTGAPCFWSLDGFSFKVKVPLLNEKQEKYHCTLTFRARLKKDGFYKISYRKRSVFRKD